MPRDFYVKIYVGLVFDVDDFGAMLRLPPALRRLIRSLCVEVLDKGVGHGRPNVRESPGDSLIVANDNVGHAGQSNSSDIEIAGLEMSLIPQVRHLMPEMHVIREQRLAGDRVSSRDYPVVRSIHCFWSALRPDFIC